MVKKVDVRNFLRVDHASLSWPKCLVTKTLTRDLFAVANLLVFKLFSRKRHIQSDKAKRQLFSTDEVRRLSRMTNGRLTSSAKSFILLLQVLIADYTKAKAAELLSPAAGQNGSRDRQRSRGGGCYSGLMLLLNGRNSSSQIENIQQRCKSDRKAEIETNETEPDRELYESEKNQNALISVLVSFGIFANRWMFWERKEQFCANLTRRELFHITKKL